MEMYEVANHLDAVFRETAKEAINEWLDNYGLQLIGQALADNSTASVVIGNSQKSWLDAFPQEPSGQCDMGIAFQMAVDRAVMLHLRALHVRVAELDGNPVPSATDLMHHDNYEQTRQWVGEETYNTIRNQGRMEGWQESRQVLAEHRPGY